MLPRAILRFSRTLQPPAFIFTSINVFLINEKQPLIRERLVETCIRSSKRRVNMKVQLEAQLGEQSEYSVRICLTGFQVHNTSAEFACEVQCKTSKSDEVRYRKTHSSVAVSKL